MEPTWGQLRKKISSLYSFPWICNYVQVFITIQNNDPHYVSELYIYIISGSVIKTRQAPNAV